MDLRQFCYGDNPAGCRRVLALINGIPRDSAYRRARLGEDLAEWDNRTEFAATTVDLLNVLIRTQLAQQPSEPLQQVPRPWRTPEPVEEVSLGGLNDFLKGF